MIFFVMCLLIYYIGQSRVQYAPNRVVQLYLYYMLCSYKEKKKTGLIHMQAMAHKTGITGQKESLDFSGMIELQCKWRIAPRIH